ncbi:MAG: MmpS family transport accessory protein, partial [Actinomycetota bacterium]|nr:MmpS family transport accessory protein [Actinomycetota bacterium]
PSPPGYLTSSAYGAGPPPMYAGPPGYPAPPGYQLPSGYEIKKKKRFYKRVWFWVLAFVLLVVIITVTAVSKVANDAVNKKHEVAYNVTGTVRADITYYSSDGSNKSASESVAKQKLPWAKTITVKGDFSGFVLTATPSDLASKGTLACSITVDGKVVSTDRANSTGIVSCDGTGYNGK